MANYYIGRDGVRYEQSSNGAFYITQDKKDDSDKFNEMMENLNGTHETEED